MEGHGRSWNILESHGTFQNLMESHGTLWKVLVAVWEEVTIKGENRGKMR